MDGAVFYVPANTVARRIHNVTLQTADDTRRRRRTQHCSISATVITVG